MSTSTEKVLEVKNLEVRFARQQGMVKILQDISFDLYRGRSLGIVGESGSGKSSMALALMRLIVPPLGLVGGDYIKLEGRDILNMPIDQMSTIRGNRMSMIFQEAMTSLNPVLTIGEQIVEIIQVHQKLPKREAKERCLELLDLVCISAPNKRMGEYAHQISGGMRQRVMIAMALACNPAVLIADEPTTALDVTTQAQIIDLLRRLQEDINMSVILITHDLGVVAELCHDVAVMYCGRFIEQAAIQDIFDHPLHPYTRALLDSIPSLNQRERGKLLTIEGVVPAFDRLPSGCHFQDRCRYAQSYCRVEEPRLQEIDPNHYVECLYPLKDKG